MKHQLLIEYLGKYGQISKLEELDIIKYFTPIETSRKQILIAKHQTCNKLFFVNKGLIRAYYTNVNGKEITRMIAWEGRFLTNIVSFKNFSENDEQIECIEKAEILYVNKQNFDFLMKSSLNLKSIYADILEEYNALHIKRFQSINTFNLDQKFEYLNSDFPNLINRASDNILASFLGISREYLVKNKHLLYNKQ